MLITLRFVDEDLCIQQKVARLLLVAKSMTGEELGRELVLKLSTELGITDKRLLASIHDRASVNNANIVVDIGLFFPHC